MILDVERFIHEVADTAFPTRRRYYKAYYQQLCMLFQCNQLIVLRDGDRITGVCGFLRVHKAEEHQINKLTWQTPKDISGGNVLYISFCVLRKGERIYNIVRELKDINKHLVDEVFWFNVPSSRFVRRRNILKEKNDV